MLKYLKMPQSTPSSVDEKFFDPTASSITSELDPETWAESSRKRRKLTPKLDDRTIKRANNDTKSTAATDSRVKAKKTGLLPSQSPTGPGSGSVEGVVPKREKSTFDQLGVHPWLVSSLSSLAITRPTGIQKGCIPEILKGCDCIGGSRTGSGKTIAFAVPILQKWAEDPTGIFAVVLTPTR